MFFISECPSHTKHPDVFHLPYNLQAVPASSWNQLLPKLDDNGHVALSQLLVVNISEVIFPFLFLIKLINMSVFLGALKFYFKLFLTNLDIHPE